MAHLKAVPILIPSTLQRVMHIMRKALGYRVTLPGGYLGPAGLNRPTSFSWLSGKYYKLSAPV